MYLISVAPFTKSGKIDSLTYFSAKAIEPGLIVTVPLRRQNVKGLVIESRNIKEVKQEIKNSAFELKKIKGVSKSPLLKKEFIEAASKTAEYFVSSTGSVLNTLIPNVILENLDKVKFSPTSNKESKTGHKSKTDKKVEISKYLLQSSDPERYSDYKSLIRSQFAKNKSVFFCVPTVEDCYYAESLLTKGIEKSAFVFNSQLTKKQILEKWQEVISRKKPTLIIATGKFLSLPINDLGTIIIERENSPAYKTMIRPYLDIRKFAEFLAEINQASFIVGDILLRAETLWRYDQHEFMEYTPIKFRTLSTNTGQILKLDENGTLSNELKSTIESAHQKNEQSLLFVSRRGLSPLIICGDCGQVVTCERCSSPIVLYGQNPVEPENYFKCNHCGLVRSAGETCQNCGSWKLTELGIGTEKVCKELANFIPENKIFLLDKDTAKTIKQARNIVRDFLENPGGVLVGTEMALLYLHKEIENAFVVSIDSMMSLPDFQIKERILNILLHIKILASQKFIIQTRDPNNLIFKEAIQGNLADFYRQEFIERKKLNYPPFSLIIKISTGSTNKEKLLKDFEVLKKYFLPFDFQYYSALVEKVKGRFIVNGIIRLKRNDWPNADLAAKMKNLPPQYKIEIDASSVI